MTGDHPEPRASFVDSIGVWAARGDDIVFDGATGLYLLRAGATEPKELADLEADAILVDGERVYGVRQGKSDVATGEVWWHSLKDATGGTIAAKQSYPTGIAKCGNRIYWSASGVGKDRGAIFQRFPRWARRPNLPLGSAWRV